MGHNHTTRAMAAGLVLIAVLSACSSSGPSAPVTSAPPTSPGASPAPSATGGPQAPVVPVVTGTIASSLRTPWGLAFLPDGSALISERDTTLIKKISPAPGGSYAVSVVGNVPGVVPGGEGGLLGLAVAKDFSKTHWLYAYFTAASDNRIVRMRYDNGRLGSPEPILTGIPKGGIHNGGRIGFGPDGMLYAGTGETGDGSLAQDLGSLGGKILRMTPDGKPAPGNPFPSSVIWTYGHRNIQGLAWDSAGRMWASEFGPTTFDELNLIQKGKNYGWPIVDGKAGDPRFTDPLEQWPTGEASPSGIAIDHSTVFMATLRGSRLWEIRLSGAQTQTPQAFFVGTYGRLRTIAVSPDGSLWLTTSNWDGRGNPAPSDDRILRVTLRPA